MIVATVVNTVLVAVDVCVVVHRTRGYLEVQKACAAGNLARGVKRAKGSLEHVLAAAEALPSSDRSPIPILIMCMVSDLW